MWSGAPGEVRGDGQCYGNTGTAGFYGFDNCNSGDSQGITVYYGPSGSEQCPSLKAQLYATAFAQPPIQGIQQKNPVTTLTAGLTCITKYSEPYSHATSIADVKQYLVRCAV